MAATTITSSALSSLSLHTTSTPRFSLLKPIINKPFSSFSPRLTQFLSLSSQPITITTASSSDIDTTFFDNLNPEDDIVFDPPTPPEDFVPPPSFDEEPMETEEEIAAAYEDLYGAGYSGVSYLGNDVYVMDSKVKKTTGFGSKGKREKIRDGFEERVVQVRRVTKVVKGGKQLHFRAIVVVGDKQGQVGVGVGKAKEVIAAVQKSAVNARRNIITVPMTKYLTFPHRSDGDYGAAKVMLRPASPGTGVIAGGAVRIVLEMAGVENALGKQIGSKNALNNARATVVAVQKMRQFSDVARERGIPMEELWK
ncbi:30S ribosomal protein S5, chloroplastic [Ricinus communis]|uniref:Small ribosomal subunit protein uS5c n=1 Tax=Ricinus communis TaxID=3988 RepID=B9RBC3_RICCO|nr:30S ribosomal protein S5, chloroplastic [Ricinus communis]EEF50844.1 30S ribosomal protein S5, putative [Ricinus communis]|eukprot:XP_002509457.1 30S ribosomal protein S5, chloroplastic [Ricinus communis]